MLRYKVDIIAALKKKGFSSYKIRREKLISEAAMTRLRHGLPPDAVTLNKLCSMLNTQPGRILEYVPDTETGAEQAEQAEN